MRIHTRAWLTAAGVLVFALQLGVAWLAWQHLDPDETEQAWITQVERRNAAARIGDPVPPPTAAHDLARQAQLQALADHRSAVAASTPAERIALAILQRDLTALRDGEAAGHLPATVPLAPTTGTDPRTGGGVPADHRTTGEGTGPRVPDPARDYSSGLDHQQIVCPVDPARNSMIITEPGVTFAFELSPKHYDDGICLLSNLSGGDYIVEVHGIDPAEVLIDGHAMSEPTVAVHGDMTIQALRPASVYVRPGKIPPPAAPENDG
jgi:hypothetical protein